MIRTPTAGSATRFPDTTATYPGEPSITWRPSSVAPASAPLVLLSHGAGIGADVFQSDSIAIFIGLGRDSWVLRAGPTLATAGLTTTAIDGGGSATSGPTSGAWHWGSEAALDRMDAVVAAAGATRIALVGSSMGTFTSLRWALRNPTKVASLSLILPLSNIGILWDQHPELRASITAAWADPHDPALDLTGPAGAALAGIPTRLWWSSNDDTIDPATITALAARIGSSCELMPDQHAGHAVAEPFDLAEVVSHVWAHP